MVPFTVISILILLNGIFVAAEFALIGVPRTVVERRASQGHRTALMLSRILHDPILQDRYIATAQIGITFTSLGLGMYGEHVLASWIHRFLESIDAPSLFVAHAFASSLSLMILTYLHIVVGEMVPKSLALQYSEQTALLITPPMTWMKTATYPLVIGLTALGNGILRILGIRRQITAGHYVTPEELEYLIAESRDEGMLQEEAGRVLQDLLEFGDLTAGEIMVPRIKIVGIPLDSDGEEIRRVVVTSRHSRYPVYETNLDHIVGSVHIKDLFSIVSTGRRLTRRDLREIPYIPETMGLEGVLAAMRLKRTRIAVVMDEFGGTAGLITIEDLFEEVSGYTEDEAAASSGTRFDSKGRLHVSGTMRLEEAGELLECTIDHEEVTTVSGLILAMLGRRAKIGDTVVYDGVKFQVTDVRGYGVERCIATPVPKDD